MAFAILLTLVAFAGFALAFLGFMGLTGKLPPNSMIGIRTPFTMASGENWYDTHRAAAPVMMYGGVLVFAVAMAFVPFAFAGKLSDTVALIVLIVSIILALITVGLGWYAGSSFALARSTRGDSS